MLAVLPLPGGSALAFERPSKVLVAEDIDGVLPVLREVDAALAAGGWVAGYLAYEAAAAFDPALVTLARTLGGSPAGDLDRPPLAAFGVFARPRREPLAAALGRRQQRTRSDPRRSSGHHRSTPQRHAAQVAAVRAAIARGDTYQVNLTWRLRAPFAGSAEDLFAPPARRPARPPRRLPRPRRPRLLLRLAGAVLPPPRAADRLPADEGHGAARPPP